MPCTIYRSESWVYTYLYLAEGKELEDLPETSMQGFGEPELVVELDLSSRRWTWSR